MGLFVKKSMIIKVDLLKEVGNMKKWLEYSIGLSLAYNSLVFP